MACPTRFPSGWQFWACIVCEMKCRFKWSIWIVDHETYSNFSWFSPKMSFRYFFTDFSKILRKSCLSQFCLDVRDSSAIFFFLNSNEKWEEFHFWWTAMYFKLSSELIAHFVAWLDRNLSVFSLKRCGLPSLLCRESPQDPTKVHSTR